MKTYQDLHDTLVEIMGLKAGDVVKVLRKAKSFEYGWSGSWNREMTPLVGNEYTVNGVSSDYVSVNGVDWVWPIHVLEKVSSEREILLDSGDYTAIVRDNGTVEVGCQNISFKTLKEIYTIAERNHNKV